MHEVLDIVDGAASIVVGFLVQIIPGGGLVQAVAVSIVILLSIAALSSFVRHRAYMIEHMREFKASQGLVDRMERDFHSGGRYRDSHSMRRVDAEVLRVYWLQEVSRGVRWTARMFGGHFIGVRSFYPRAAFTAPTLVTSVAITCIGWPNEEEVSRWMDFGAMAADRVVEVFGALSVASLSVIVLGAFIVFASPVPIIDRVRARGEAAVQASSKLFRVSAALGDLYHAVAKWRRSLERDGDRIIDEVVLENSGGKYRWQGGRIVLAGPGVPTPRQSSDDDGYKEALDCLFEELEQLRRSGLDMVASRLCGAASGHLSLADIHLSQRLMNRKFLLTSFKSLEFVKTATRNSLPWFWGVDEVSELMEEEMEFYLEQSSDSLRSMRVENQLALGLLERHLYEAVNALERQKSGAWWVRIAAMRYA